MDAASVDHEVVGGGIFDVGVKVRAYEASAGEVAFGVKGEGADFVQLLQAGHVSGAMFGWSDEADVYAMINRASGKICATADEDRAAGAGEASHELIGLLHEIPEVRVQTDEFPDRGGNFRDFVFGQKTGEVWRLVVVLQHFLDQVAGVHGPRGGLGCLSIETEGERPGETGTACAGFALEGDKRAFGCSFPRGSGAAHLHVQIGAGGF
jgi:hypothetical protein